MIQMSLHPQITRQFIHIIGKIVEEFRLHITKDGWKVISIDPATVAEVEINLPKENFLSYMFKESDLWTSNIDDHPTGVQIDEIAVGIEIDKVKDFLDAGSERVLDMELNEPIEFAFIQAAEKYQDTQSIPRYELIMKQGMFSKKILLMHESEVRKYPKIYKLKLDYKIQLGTLELLRVINKPGNVDYIRLGYDRDTGGMKFLATVEDGNDLFTVEKLIEIGDFHGLRELNTNGRASSLYSMDYLQSIVSVIPSDYVWLHIRQDYPLIIEFTLGTTGQCKYIQAPRVETG
ncbi:MAG: hypothetical protein PHZ02_01375 [Desulfocapsaceae bacterium]|nr:hypothetical protein [Desulfocapsaceae bacterium]